MILIIKYLIKMSILITHSFKVKKGMIKILNKKREF